MDTEGKEIKRILNILWSDLYGESIATIADDRATAFQTAEKGILEAIRTAVSERDEKIKELIKGTQPDMLDEVQDMIDNYEDYCTGFADAKIKMILALKGQKEGQENV